MASLEVRSGRDRTAEKGEDRRAAGRATFQAWVARRLEWERWLRGAENPRPAVATAGEHRAA